MKPLLIAVVLLVAAPVVRATGGSCAPEFLPVDATIVLTAQGRECTSNCRLSYLLNTDEIQLITPTTDGPAMRLRSTSLSLVHNWSYASLRNRLYCVVLPRERNPDWGTNNGARARETRTWAYQEEPVEVLPIDDVLKILQQTHLP